MEKISFNHINKQKKGADYSFQDTCLEIAKLADIKKGLAFALWKKVGNEIYQILAEMKQGEIKNPKVYILYKLKN